MLAWDHGFQDERAFCNIVHRANALKSTGPKTDEGKSVSRLNAVTHGLAALLPEAIDESPTLLDERKAKWRPELRPVGDVQESLFTEVVIGSIRVQRCQNTFLALCDQHGERARLVWDGDRRRDAAELATGLARNPQAVASRLASTPHGCDLMLQMWLGLKSSLDRHKTWTDRQRSIALDLLGIHPDLRDSETPVDPSKGDIYEARQTLIAAETDRLTAARERTRGLDASERAMAEKTLGVEFTKPMQLLDRYERNAYRRYQLGLKALKAAQLGTAVATPVAKPATPPPVVKQLPAVERPKAIEAPVQVAIPRATERTQFAPAATGLNRHQRRKMAALERRAG